MDPDPLITNQVFAPSYLYPPRPSIIPSPSISSTFASPTVYLKSICPWNIDALKSIHLALFPVHYDESFYYQVQKEGEFSKLVYVNGVAVGTVCCRIERAPDQQNTHRLYIMTLGVLESHRRRHLGHLLLQYILDQAQLHHNITQIYLHVQTTNTTALKFYHQHGFREVALVRNYYRLADKDAYVVIKNITHS